MAHTIPKTICRAGCEFGDTKYTSNMEQVRIKNWSIVIAGISLITNDIVQVRKISAICSIVKITLINKGLNNVKKKNINIFLSKHEDDFAENRKDFSIHCDIRGVLESINNSNFENVIINIIIESLRKIEHLLEFSLSSIEGSLMESIDSKSEKHFLLKKTKHHTNIWKVCLIVKMINFSSIISVAAANNKSKRTYFVDLIELVPNEMIWMSWVEDFIFQNSTDDSIVLSIANNGLKFVIFPENDKIELVITLSKGNLMSSFAWRLLSFCPHLEQFEKAAILQDRINEKQLYEVINKCFYGKIDRISFINIDGELLFLNLDN